MNFALQKGRTLRSAARLLFRRPDVFWTLLRVRRQKLTFLGIGALADLANAVVEVECQRIPGILIEAGCALGGSSILIARAKLAGRPLYIYDTFEQIPPPGEGDGDDALKRFEKIRAGQAEGIAGERYYGYLGDLAPRVRESFARLGCPVEPNRVTLFKGLIEDTLRLNEPVALAHIDCDWHSPVKACLEQVAPLLPRGGRLILDDYGHWSGARKAVDEYFASRAGFRFEYHARLHIIKE